MVAARDGCDPLHRCPDAVKRPLLVIPIIHTDSDHGTLAEGIRARRVAQLGLAAARKSEGEIGRLWSEVEAYCRSLPPRLEGYRLYQDGLPVCGREVDIVKDLAGQGNRNHALLLELHDRGARITGTESPGLLLEELEMLRAGLRCDPERPAEPPPAASILERRDRFIGARIGETLLPGEKGILLVGALHDIVPYLPADILVTFPLAGFGR